MLSRQRSMSTSHKSQITDAGFLSQMDHRAGTASPNTLDLTRPRRSQGRTTSGRTAVRLSLGSNHFATTDPVVALRTRAMTTTRGPLTRVGVRATGV
jgi:hypothetical protein